MVLKVILGAVALVFVLFLLVVLQMAKTEAGELERDLREADRLKREE